MLKVERIGGLAGLGGVRSRLKSDGEIAFATLSLTDQKAVEALFKTDRDRKALPSQMRDEFRYRITRTGAAGDSIVVSEEKMPAALIACVQDRIT
jgi:hypothetical protein